MFLKKIKVLFLIMFGCGLKLTAVEQNSPYVNIKKVFSYTDSDYFQNQHVLEDLIKSNDIQTIIEVGCWYGKSTIFMAQLLPEEGKIYAVDSWIGYPVEIYANTLYVYERFLSNVLLANLTNKIIPIRKTSLSASHDFSGAVDMIYIDADHSYCSVYSDITAWSKHLNKGGVLCGNLYSKHGNKKYIKKAVLDYCKDHHKNAFFIENLWEIR